MALGGVVVNTGWSHNKVGSADLIEWNLAEYPWFMAADPRFIHSISCLVELNWPWTAWGEKLIFKQAHRLSPKFERENCMGEEVVVKLIENINKVVCERDNLDWIGK